MINPEGAGKQTSWMDIVQTLLSTSPFFQAGFLERKRVSQDILGVGSFLIVTHHHASSKQDQGIKKAYTHR